MSDSSAGALLQAQSRALQRVCPRYNNGEYKVRSFLVLSVLAANPREGGLAVKFTVALVPRR